MQALLPAIYPMLKSSFSLSFEQIGLLTLIFQVTASLLQLRKTGSSSLPGVAARGNKLHHVLNERLSVLHSPQRHFHYALGGRS